MVFSSIIFIFYFLPVFLVGYYVSGWRAGALLAGDVRREADWPVSRMPKPISKALRVTSGSFARCPKCRTANWTVPCEPHQPARR